jgi:hypothetical protein
MSTRRSLSKKDKLNILWATYGSLTVFNKPLVNPSVVGRTLGFNRATISTFLTRFKEYNCNAERVMLRKKYTRKYNPIGSLEREDYIVSE